MILDDLLMKCMGNHAVENCQDCPELHHCLLLNVIHEQSHRNLDTLEELLPHLSEEEHAVIQQVEERYQEREQKEEPEQPVLSMTPLFAILLAWLLRLLEWIGYGVMALMALAVLLLACWGLGWLLWWLLLWLGGVLSALTTVPSSVPSPEPTPWVTPSPGPHDRSDLPQLWGRLHLISNQPGIRVRLWDEVENKWLELPSLYRDVPAGPYELLAEKPGFTPYRAHIIVSPSDVTTVRVVLKPTAGKLQIRTRPPGAEVLVDGELRGRTGDRPLVITGLAAGPHTLAIGRTGYRRLEQAVNLAPLHDQDLTLTLEQGRGQLSVSTQPTQATVLLDGQNRGSSGRNGRWQAMVPAGFHRVSARKRGYRAAEPVTVELEDGGAQEVAVELEPLETASGVRRPASGEGGQESGAPGTEDLEDTQVRGVGTSASPSSLRTSRSPSTLPDQETGGAEEPLPVALHHSPPVAQRPGMREEPVLPVPVTSPLASTLPPASPLPPAVPWPDWPVYAGNAALTGNRDDRPLRHGRRLWRARVGKFFRAVAVGRYVYLGSMDGGVYAVDLRSGCIRWRYPTGGAIWSTPVVQRGVLYIGSDDGFFYALSADSGRLRWRHRLGSALRGAPSIVGSTVVVGGEDGYLTALRLQAAAPSHRVAWTFQAGGAIRAAPVVADSTILIGTRTSSVLAVDAYSGKKLWGRDALGWKLFSFWDTLGPVRVPISYGQGRLYVARTDNKDRWTQNDIHALDPLTGKRVASGTIHGYGTAPVFYRDALYLGSGDGHLYALDARTLKPRWRYNTRHYLTSTPAVAGGQVAFGGFDGAIYVLSASAGRLLHRFSTNGIVSSSPTLVDGQMFAGSEDGYLYAFE